MSEKQELNDFTIYLAPTDYIESDQPEIINYARTFVEEEEDARIKAVKLYYAVRDEIIYNPYRILFTPEGFKARTTLSNRFGYCGAKAVLLAALGRAEGIPARLGFADVKNHLTSEKLRAIMQTDIFAWHGYTEFYLNGKWVRATPAFDKFLCEATNIKPLEFDGLEDSIFHEFDRLGQKHMEYVNDHGRFADFPFDQIIASFKVHYPAMAKILEQNPRLLIDGSFDSDAFSG